MHNKLVAPHKVDRSTEHYAAVKAEMAKRVTDLDGCNVARDWEWLADYLVSVANVNENPVYDAVER